MGGKRGGIDERWFSSTTKADNGPLTTPDEGLSYVVFADGASTEKVLLRDAVADLGAALVGEDIWQKYGKWPMYSKFFDYEGPLFHHLHLNDAAARRVGRIGKPGAYYFPPQLNNHLGTFPHTYFGFAPETSRQEVRQRLLQYETADNRITELSRAYRIELGTGW